MKNLNYILLACLLFILILGAMPLKAQQAQEAQDPTDQELTDEGEDSSVDLSLSSERGHPWEYDQGPQKNSEFLKIFSSLPNYRAIGKAVIGDERFRWHWGPVFYRGRLGKNEIKILVIGQEGAQDEALAKKTFTGGTGQHMQRLLDFLGISHSYLFVNTFIYSIYGQYQDATLPNAIKGDLWLAQSPQSPIVQTRNKFLNQILENNRDSLRLVVAVGSGAKDTLTTWVESKGGKCAQQGKVETCDASVIGEKIRLVGVAHPGMAGQVDKKLPKKQQQEQLKQILATLRKSFQTAVNHVAESLAQDPNWLPVDAGCTRSDVVTQEYEEDVKNEDGSTSKVTKTFLTFSEPYTYRHVPVPFRDFAFGSNWRLGSAGTASNRTSDQRSIKIFSAKGVYNDKVLWYTPNGSSLEDSGYINIDGDLPYEAPRTDYNAFDPGPEATKWSKLLMGEQEGYEWPDFNDLGATSDKSFGTGPIYRGRLNEARVLVLADQESHDDMFTGRALSGDGGQKLQHFLQKMGMTQSYAIIRTLPVDTLPLSSDELKDIENYLNKSQRKLKLSSKEVTGILNHLRDRNLSEREIRKIVFHPQVEKVRNKILEELLNQNHVQVILTVGPYAQEALEKAKLKTNDILVVNLKTAKDEEAAQNWTEALKVLSKASYDKDEKSDFKFAYNKREFKNTRLEINRYDFPFATPRWMGTSGSLATRSLDSDDLYQMTMPRWATQWKAPKLTHEELQSLKDGGWVK